ncbi:MULTISPECIES: hypothetical protein [Streptacidiphilus]|uniref:Secreted protein n=2 Tax=Streptacidiphilus TaxID=228398 RepID=A0ABV6UL45_9ACTN|nr:hypothetical protein [Streptacidiphilus jeojiense]
MRKPQRLVTGVAALALIGGATAVAAVPAQAATSAAVGCQFPTGTTGTTGTNAHGLPEFSGGSTFTKPSTSSTTCHDLNVWKGKSGVSYEGWLYYGNGNWGACTAGYVKYTGSPIVLCTDVLAGTVMGVTSSSGAGQSITIED